MYFCEVTSRLYRYPGGKIFCRNRSILHCFRDKCIFAFYTEIQDGYQKWRGKRFLGKVVRKSCIYPTGKKSCRNCSILHPFQDKCIFAFNAEIQDDRQNGGKAIFLEKLPVNSTDTLRVENFVEIALSCTVSEINMFWHFMQKFKMYLKWLHLTQFPR